MRQHRLGTPDEKLAASLQRAAPLHDRFRIHVGTHGGLVCRPFCCITSPGGSAVRTA